MSESNGRVAVEPDTAEQLQSALARVAQLERKRDELVATMELEQKGKGTNATDLAAQEIARLQSRIADLSHDRELLMADRATAQEETNKKIRAAKEREATKRQRDQERHEEEIQVHRRAVAELAISRNALARKLKLIRGLAKVFPTGVDVCGLADVLSEFMSGHDDTEQPAPVLPVGHGHGNHWG